MSRWLRKVRLGEAAAIGVRHGVEVETGPVQRPGAAPGARGTGTSVYFRDPDGSLLEFITYPR
jgi:catechol 2,3-dioxygenase-like lactoylglutathione lyase family enzyme